MMSAGKILVVDDDQNICELLRLYIEKEGFEVRIANDGRKALEIFEEQNPDLIMLDIMLPELDGWQVCREIRKKSQCPIIMLTAKGEVFDKVLGLELGADDYVVKPFELEVLDSRIRALLRRAGNVSGQCLTCGSIMLDQNRMMVFIGEEEIVVSQSEYQLLLLLIRNKGKTVTRERILSDLWDKSGSYVNDNTLTVTMKRLREKLHNPSCIKTVRSFGYRMEDNRSDT